MASDLEPETEHRSRRGLIGCGVFLAVALLLAGGYTAACAMAPLPAPTVRFDEELDGLTRENDPAAIQAAVDADQLGAATGWLDSETVWANDEQPRPIASVTKLVTALVCLEAQPVEAGTDGPVHVWSAADAARTAAFKDVDGVAFDIPVGSEMTVRQMLQMMLLPSANDVASAYAVSVFGSTEAFAAAAEDWRLRNGLDSLRIVEPSGMDEANVATAADLVRLGRLALQNPLVAETTAMEAAEMPWGVGTVFNTNPLLGAGTSVLGLKTGGTSAAGYNLVAAQRIARGERELISISAVLGRRSAGERASDAQALLRTLNNSVRDERLLEEGQPVGTAITVDGIEITITASASAVTQLRPGDSASLSLDAERLGPVKAGAVAGTARLTGTAGDVLAEVPLLTERAISEPDLGWRLTHPLVLLGW